MFSSHQPLIRKRQESLGTKLLELGPKILIIFARFQLKSREYIEILAKTMGRDNNNPIELFFVCEELNLKDQYNPPNYFAAFSWFIGAKERVQAQFSELRFCQVNELSLLSIQRVFTILCETSFIEIEFFERLGATEAKTIKRTTNPFVQVILYKNVSYFTNLDTANEFISKELPKVASVYELLSKRKELTSDQKHVNKMLFGTIRKQMVHLTYQDLALLRNLYQELKKYEIENEEDMFDQNEQFENVSYRALQENESQLPEYFSQLMHLKNRREKSIQEMRDRLKDQERTLNRWDSQERIRL